MSMSQSKSSSKNKFKDELDGLSQAINDLNIRENKLQHQNSRSSDYDDNDDKDKTPRPEPKINLETVADEIKNAKKILILTGAGISVSCGIPDFRSEGVGVYAQLKKLYPRLRNPTDMFNINYFVQDPRAFFDFATKLWPGNFTPSKTHYFMKRLNDKNQLLRNYTQNIDTLEQVAKIDSSCLIQCHGSFEFATCQSCRKKYRAEQIKDIILNKSDEDKLGIPYCKSCGKTSGRDKWTAGRTNPKTGRKYEYRMGELPIIKPDIVFFGEELPPIFHQNVKRDSKSADLLIVIGSSLQVSPVNLIPDFVPQTTKKILINKEEIQSYYSTTRYDYELYGYCDEIVEAIEEILDGKNSQNRVFKETDDFQKIQSNAYKKYFVKGRKFVFQGADARYVLA